MIMNFKAPLQEEGKKRILLILRATYFNSSTFTHHENTDKQEAKIYEKIHCSKLYQMSLEFPRPQSASLHDPPICDEYKDGQTFDLLIIFRNQSNFEKINP